MKCSLGISNFLEEIPSLSPFYCFPLFLCIDHWGRLSYLLLLFFGTLICRCFHYFLTPWNKTQWNSFSSKQNMRPKFQDAKPIKRGHLVKADQVEESAPWPYLWPLSSYPLRWSPRRNPMKPLGTIRYWRIRILFKIYCVLCHLRDKMHTSYLMKLPLST